MFETKPAIDNAGDQPCWRSRALETNADFVNLIRGTRNPPPRRRDAVDLETFRRARAPQRPVASANIRAVGANT